MKQQIGFIHTILFLLLFLTAQASIAAPAETRYVTDSLLISIRTGPGKDFKVIGTIKTGTEMKVLEDGDEFIKIETKDKKVGWVPKYYTETKLPKSMVISSLKAEIERLEKEIQNSRSLKDNLENTYSNVESELSAKVEKLTRLKEENDIEIARLSTSLEEVSEKYNTLLVQSEDPLKTAKERDSLKQEIKLAKSQLTSLEAQNKSLKNYKMIYWFATGGGIFLLGWLIGKLSQRSAKRSLSL